MPRVNEQDIFNLASDIMLDDPSMSFRDAQREARRTLTGSSSPTRINTTSLTDPYENAGQTPVAPVSSQSEQSQQSPSYGVSAADMAEIETFYAAEDANRRRAQAVAGRVTQQPSLYQSSFPTESAQGRMAPGGAMTSTPAGEAQRRADLRKAGRATVIPPSYTGPQSGTGPAYQASAGPAYEQLLVRVMKIGMPREQADAMFKQQFQGTRTNVAQMSTWFQNEYLQGYSGMRVRRQGTQEAEGGVPSEAAWQYTPEHLRYRFSKAKPVSEMEKDKYGRPVVPQGQILRSGAAFSFPTSAITEASYLARTPQGKTVMDWEASKTEKRMQMLGAHELVEMRGLRKADPFIKAGPASGRPEEHEYIVKSAMILGGEIGGPGTALIDPSVGQAFQRTSIDIAAEKGKSFDWMAPRGTEWGPGEQMQLAGGLAGKSTGKWSYRVTDVARTSEDEKSYRYTLERFASAADARLRTKMGAQKSQGSIQDLSGITDPQGNPLGIQYASGFKSLQGLVYERMKAIGADRVREITGLDKLPGSYSEIGPDIVQAFMKHEAPGMLQTIQVPTTLTLANLERARESGSLVPGSATGIGGGVYRAKLQYQALVGDLAKQFGHQYPVNRPFLSVEEMEKMKRAAPEEYERITYEGAPEREAYTEVANAFLATSGGYQDPKGTVEPSQAKMLSLFSQAEKIAQEESGTGDPSVAAITKQFMSLMASEESGLAGSPLAIPTDAGRVVMPSADVLQKFGATGKWSNEEMSKYVSRARQVLSAYASGGDEALTEAATEFRQAQGELAMSKNFTRGLTGSYLTRASGDVIRSSMGLQPGQAHVPGMAAGTPIRMGRFPSAGSQIYGLVATAIGESRAKELGINPDEMTMSMELLQANQGDADGDLAFAVEAGDISVDENGQLTDASGSVLDTSTKILAAAKSAVNTGAQKLYQQMAGIGKPFLNMDDAKAELRKMSVSGRAVSPEGIEQEVRTGLELRGRIAASFNPFREASVNIPEAGVAGMGKLFGLAYGRAQRPEALTPGMSKFMDLRNVNIVGAGRGKLFQGSGLWSVGKGGPDITSKVMKGIGGLQAASVSRLAEVRGEPEEGQERGELALTPQEFGNLLAGPGQRERAGVLASMYSQYRAISKAGGDTTAIENKMMEESGTSGEWMQSPVGQLFAPAAIERAFGTAEKAGLEMTAGVLGLSKEDFAGAVAVRKLQRQRVLSRARKTLPTEQAAVERLEAVRATEAGVGLVQPGQNVPAVDTYVAPQPSAATAPTGLSEFDTRMNEWRAETGGQGSFENWLGANYAVSPRELGGAAPAAAGGGGRRRVPPTGAPPSVPPSQGPPNWPGGGQPVQPQQPGGPGPAQQPGVGGQQPVINWPAVGRAEFGRAVKTMTERLGVWSENVKEAAEGTGELTKWQTRTTREMIKLRNTIQRGEQDPKGLVQADVDVARKLIAGGFGGRIGQMEARLGEEKWTPSSGRDGGGPSGFQAVKRLMIGWTPMQMKRAMGMFTDPQAVGMAAQAEIPGWALTQAIGGAEAEMPGGVAGGVMQYQAARRQAQIQGGRAQYRAWGAGLGLMDPLRTAQGIAGGPLGAGLAAGIGLNALGGMAMFGTTAAALAGPVGLGIAGIGTAIGGMGYLSSYGDETAENQLAASEGPWGRIRSTLGYVLSSAGGERAPPSLGVGPGYSARQAEAGEQLRGTQLDQLSARERMAVLNYSAENLEGGIWEGMDEGQRLQALTPYASQLGTMTGDEIAGGDIPEWIQKAIGAGMERKQFAGITQEWGMAPGQWSQVAQQIVGAPSPAESEQSEFLAGQWEPLKKFGVSAMDIRERAYAGELEPLEGMQKMQLAAGGNLAEQMRLYGFDVAEPETGIEIESMWRETPTMQAQLGLTQRLTGMGAGMGGARRAVEGLGGMGDMLGFGRMLGGDAWEMSRMAGDQGLTDTYLSALREVIRPEDMAIITEMANNMNAIIDTDTGLRVGIVSNAATEQFGAAALAAMPGEESALVQGYAMMGSRQRQQAQMGLQRGQQDFQMGQQQRQLGWSQVSQFGGDFEGFQTRGSFAIQSELRKLSRIWEDFTQDYQEQQRAVQYGQFMENWGVRAERAPVQFQRQREDLAFRGAQASMQYGWGQEDIQENLRYATGRQRRQLLKQQDRQTISYAMQMGQMGVQGGRIDENERWSQEDLERQKRHFLERFALQDEYQFKFREYTEQRRMLEDELQEIRMFSAHLNIEMQTEALEKNEALQEQMRAIQDAQIITTQHMENNIGLTSMWAKNVSLFMTRLNTQAETLLATVGAIESALAGQQIIVGTP